MDVLCHFSNDDNITALATKLCAILSAKVTVMQTQCENFYTRLFHEGAVDVVDTIKYQTVFPNNSFLSQDL